LSIVRVIFAFQLAARLKARLKLDHSLGTQNAKRASATSDRFRMSPKTCCWMSVQGGQNFEKAARAAVKKWRYRPGMEDGKPASMMVIETIRFQPPERR
jgi:hypothetical protein